MLVERGIQEAAAQMKGSSSIQIPGNWKEWRGVVDC